ncbi:MAG: helix-turn-helix domain-containing protein [Prevotella sp.]|jgi:DNA-binding transcriptional regulator YiaG|nr:helix-turn-helix domain-containing protein [Prevotella sp.]
MEIKELVKEKEEQMIVLTAKQLNDFAEDLIEKHHKDLIAIIKEDRQDKIITQSEAADQLHICSRTLKRWAQAGLINILKIGGKNMYFQKDIDRMLSSE